MNDMAQVAFRPKQNIKNISLRSGAFCTIFLVNKIKEKREMA
jgi:hypothetical protein